MKAPKTAAEWLAVLEDFTRLRSWKYRDLKKALESADAQEVSRDGDHRTWKHGDYRDLVTLVDNGNKPLPIGYVKDVRALMRAVVAQEDDNEDDG